MIYSAVAIVLLCAAAGHSQSMFERINDFDGDGLADFAVTRHEGGLKIWYVWQSLSGYQRQHWGIETDSPAAGDYDGDGKTDFAILRRSFAPEDIHRCFIHIQQSSDGAHIVRTLPLPIESSCSPQPQDYDGDGKTDPAIFANSVTGLFITYYKSASGSTASFALASMHSPILIGDTDGDGVAELSSYRNGTPRLVSRTNPVTQSTSTALFGLPDDVFVPADFDGDGIGELGVFRPSTGDWWYIHSSNMTVNVVHWGLTGDVPVPADYDNDGKTDLAIYRSGSPNGVYHINGSTAGFKTFVWGVPDDSPVRYQR